MKSSSHFVCLACPKIRSQDDKGSAAVSIWEAGTGRCLNLEQMSIGGVSTSVGAYGAGRTSGNVKGVLFERIGKKELKKLSK